ncbi:fatty acyl-CoA reductase 2, chloroplastic-like [Actinidia eriantha]|uniref:fatty acyl-CoA reductase 2, chloroplastic-like n=1 Tax=Actinidia eriantha TaxID=165200 RepID=UPI0025852A57|nr:fatty acyl-CoA reductase 2, chloroplastic-like [Actinidia eriantha]
MSLLLASSFSTATKLQNKPCLPYRKCIGHTNNVSISRNLPNTKLGCYKNAKNTGGYGEVRVIEKDKPMEGTGRDTPAGIGIVKFLQGKNLFVTGATGFLAKVFVEKILRTNPEVTRIFLMIRAKDKDDAMKRVKTEIIESELFKCLEEIHGKSYQTFMKSKLVPVVGNMYESDLGMDSDLATMIAKEVDVIVNSAADTTFDERFDVAIEANTRGPCRLMSFAKKCEKLKLFLHFSTAYVNRDREGIAIERVIEENPSSSSFPQLDIDAEMEMALKHSSQSVELGLERARLFGWRNVYTFTKAMGEMVINSMRGDTPVIILRPSTVESTYAQPFPGWIQGNRVLDPFIISYGKGYLPGCHGDPKGHFNVVPADMVVNATIAAMAKHGMEGKSGINVYHATAGVQNPLSIGDFFKFSREYFLYTPFVDSQGKRVSVEEMKFFSNMDEFSEYIWGEIALKCGTVGATSNFDKKAEKKCERTVKQLMRLTKLYEPYMFNTGWFHNGNIQKLMDEMSEEEKEDFGIDFGSINWRNYITQVHIPGMKKHVLKGRMMIG